MFSLAAFADQAEQPVGLLLNAGGSKLVRFNSETPLAARPGDLLFSGDVLKTEASPASFLFCPAKAMETLAPSGEVRLDAKEPKVKSGKLSPAPRDRARSRPPCVSPSRASNITV